MGVKKLKKAKRKNKPTKRSKASNKGGKRPLKKKIRRRSLRSRQNSSVLNYKFHFELAKRLHERQTISPEVLFKKLLDHTKSQNQASRKRNNGTKDFLLGPSTLDHAMKKTKDHIVLMAYVLDRWSRELGQKRKNIRTLKDCAFKDMPGVQSAIDEVGELQLRVKQTDCKGKEKLIPELEITKEGHLIAICGRHGIPKAKNGKWCFYDAVPGSDKNNDDYTDSEEENSSDSCSDTTISEMDDKVDGDANLEEESLESSVDSTDNETPKYPESERIANMKNWEPITLKRQGEDKERKKLARLFAKKVLLVLHTCNEREYWAAVQRLEPPTTDDDTKLADRPIIHPQVNNVIGWFAGYRVAVVRTEQGNNCRNPLTKALKSFPNCKAIIAVGIAYANSYARKFADVLVSDQIENFVQNKIVDGDVTNRGPREAIDDSIKSIFTHSAKDWPAMREFICTEDNAEGPRSSIAHIGCIVSAPMLIRDDNLKEQLMKHTPTAIGGEMEGWVLLELKKSLKDQHNKDISVIVIKGVADYGDTNKGDEWQWTAAKAAVDCTHYCLDKTGGVEFNADKVEGITLSQLSQ